jgi:hypothetical protein
MTLLWFYHDVQESPQHRLRRLEIEAILKSFREKLKSLNLTCAASLLSGTVLLDSTHHFYISNRNDCKDENFRILSCLSLNPVNFRNAG